MNKEEKKLSVLFLPKWYPNKNDPFHGVFIQRHAEALASYCDVYVLFAKANLENQNNVFQYEFISNNGVKEYICYYKKNISGIGLIDRIIKFFLYYIAVFKLFKKINKSFDLLHVHVLLRTGLVALIIQILYKIPFVITEHWTIYQKKLPFFRYHATKFVLKHAQKVYPVSNQLMNSMQHYGLKGNYMVVPNVVDVHFFKPSAINSKSHFLFVGDFNDKHKNISAIIDVFSELKSQYPKLKLVTIGAGYDEKLLKTNVLKNNMNETIIFLGAHDKNIILKELQNAIALVLFSNYENLPVVILEACATGVPVISTNVGGVSEMVNDENGFLIKPNDKKALKKSIELLCNNPDYFNSETVRESVVHKYSYEKIGRSYLKSYQEILEK